MDRDQFNLNKRIWYKTNGPNGYGIYENTFIPFRSFYTNY